VGLASSVRREFEFDRRDFENLGPPPLVREAIPQHLLGVLAIGEDLDDVQRL
jgi:hypothetical protein